MPWILNVPRRLLLAFLLCLARRLRRRQRLRALARRNRQREEMIDEATALVDPDGDNFVNHSGYCGYYDPYSYYGPHVPPGYEEYES
jgi:hypothetical protein